MEKLYTFLPLPSFKKSAMVLDDETLDQQRHEARRILEVLTGNGGDNWIHADHPTVKMWKGFESALALYGKVVCEEWIERGNHDEQLPFFARQLESLPGGTLPPWFGNNNFHHSHKKLLVGKLPGHYRDFFPGVEPVRGHQWEETVNDNNDNEEEQ